MATIDNLINYGGNAALGLGSNADVPAIGNNESLAVVNNAMRDIMMLNNEKNVRLYNQKIANRDNLNNLILNNQVSTGTINPEDQRYVDEANKRMQDAFVKWGGNFNDTAGFRGYQQVAQQYKDVVKQAQTNYAGLAALRQSGAGFVLDKDKNDFKNFYEGQLKKGFWNPVTPYQKLHDYSAQNLQSTILGVNGGLVSDTGIESPMLTPTVTTDKTSTRMVKGQPVTMTTQTTAPAKAQGLPKGITPETSMSVSAQGELTPFGAPTTRYYSWNNMRRNAQQAFIDGEEGFQNQQQLFDSTERWLNDPRVPNETKDQYINSMNDRLQREYMEQTGGKFGTPPKIEVIVDANGKRAIKNAVSDFAAASVLAGINGNYKVEEPGTFNEKIAKYNVDLMKANTDAWYKRAMAGTAATKARAYADNVRSQIAARKQGQEQDEFLTDIYKKNILANPLTTNLPSGKVGTTVLKADESTPIWTLGSNGIPTILKPLGNDVKEITDKQGNVVGYEGGDYEKQFLINGQNVSLNDLTTNYKDFIKRTTPVARAKAGITSLEDYLRKQIEGNNVQVNIRGANGTTNADLNKGALLIIANKNQKKYQDLPFSEPGLDIIPETQTTE